MKKRILALLLALAMLLSMTGGVLAEETLPMDTTVVEEVEATPETEETEVCEETEVLESPEVTEAPVDAEETLPPTVNTIEGSALTWVIDAEGKLTVSGEGLMPDFAEGNRPWEQYIANIREVVAEEGVMSIGAAAFSGCANLEKISLPTTLLYVGDDTFKDCSKLAEVKLAGDEPSVGAGNEAFTAVLNPTEEPTAEPTAEPTEEPTVEPTEVATEEPDAAQQVVALIDAIGEVTLDSEAAITAAQEAYEALSDEEKADITNYAVLEAAMAAFASLTEAMTAEVTPAADAKVYVTINNAGHLVLVNGAVTVKDLNSDGVLTYDEAMQAAHTAYCAGGYATESSGYGAFVTKLWNVANGGSYYFYNNGTALSAAVDNTEDSLVSAGDHLYATVLKDTTGYSDVLGKFNASSLEATAGQAFTLTLSATANNIYEGGTSDAGVVSGVQLGLWKDGTFTAIEGATTDAEGKATITLANNGTYIITAEGSVGTVPLMPPVCTVTVTGGAGITLSQTQITVTEDAPVTLTATVTPDSEAEVTWSSSDTTVATVVNGVVTAAYKSGTAIITAKAGELEATCEATVTVSALDGGKYGNVYWKLREGGVLEFSAVPGTKGDMGGSISKWSLPTYTKNHKNDIKSIVVKEGVTGIVNYAFYTLTPTSVSLPSTLTTIGNDAFDGVTSITSFSCAEGCLLSVNGKFVLKNSGTEIYMYLGKPEGVITIPDGVTKVGALFSGSDITGIIFPDSVKEISGTNYTTWEGPFVNCKKLESVTIPCDITQTGVFKGCTSLKEVTFKEGVTAIADYTFNNCTALTTINLPKSLVSFNAGAFSGCPAISTINVAEGSIYSMSGNTLIKNGTEIVYVLPTSEISGELVIPEGTTVIGDYAYTDNEKITSVKLPDSVTSIGKCAFQSCKNLTTINFPEKLTSIGNYAFQHSGLTEINLSAGITSMGYYVFADTQITSLTLPDGLSIDNENVFSGCTKLTEVSVGGNMGSRMFEDCTALKTVTLRSGVTTIGMQAFSGCAALETFSVPEGVTTIGNYAFDECTALTSISLPASLTDLASNAFSGCTKLTSITFAEGSNFKVQDGVVYDGNKLAFTMSNVSGDITVPEGITEIGEGAFSGNTAITSVKLPDSVTTIGKRAFKGCTSLKTVNLPSKLESIGNSAFSGCTSLEMVSFPKGLKTIDISAFYDCSGMTGKLYLPGSITSFGSNAFRGCTGITSAYFEDATDAANTSYGSSLLRECTSLTEVRIPETYSTKFNNLVYNCTALKKMTVPASVTNFSGSYLPDGFVYLDFRGVTSISSSLLSNMTNLKELVLPATLTSYKDSARNCHPEIIYFRGTEEQWNAINFASTTLENFEKYGTVIVFNYGTETGEAPEITKQPESATYEQGLRAAPLTIEVNEVEGVQYLYHWYCDGEYFSSGKECTVNTGVAGEFEYYCMVRCSVGGKYSEVKSDVVTVTVTEAGFAGSGTSDDPYLIATSADLERLSVLVNAGESYSGMVFKMTEDLTLPDNWQPVGATKDGTNGIKRGANLNAFSGTFDGDGHTLTVPAGYRPLFAYVNGATIRNLSIYGTQINGYGLVDCFTGVGMSGTAVTIDHVTLKSGTQTKYSGLIGARKFENGYAGCSAGYNAIIRNCTIESGVVIGYGADDTEIGGFAGRMQGTIENCVNHGTVKGASYVGGIIGTIDNSMGQCDVINCRFAGVVTASGNNAGGIVGGGYSDSSAPNGTKVTIKNCTSSGTVSGDANVGGILGGDMYVAQSWDNVPSAFKDNRFTGKVSGNSNVGALIGFYDSLNRIDDISGNYYAAGCGADQPVGKVYVVDTACATPTAYGDTIYFSTETSVADCPSVAGCGWITGYNRTDDPLGADAANLWTTDGKTVIPVASIKLNKSKVTLLQNNTYTLKATISPKTASDTSVTWTSSNGSIAAVNENGVVTGTGVGTATITAIANDGSGKSASCKVTVKYNPVKKITLAYDDKTAKKLTFNVEYDKDKTFVLASTVYPATASDPAVKFTSNNPEVVSINEDSGEFTIGKLGKATVTCTSVSNKKVKATCTINVTKVAVSKIKLTYFYTTLPSSGLTFDYEDVKGQTFNGFRATVLPLNANYRGVEWMSTNESVVTVDAETGAFTVVGAGKATIKCVSTDNSKVYASCKVTSVKTAVSSITVRHGDDKLTSKSVLNMVKDGTDKELTVTFNPTNATYQDLTWKSSNKKVVTVDENGVLTATGKGTATVTVTSKDNRRAKLSFKVKVTE